MFEEFWLGAARTASGAQSTLFKRAQIQLPESPSSLVMETNNSRIKIPDILLLPLRSLSFNAFVKKVLTSNPEEDVGVRRMRLLWYAIISEVYPHERECLRWRRKHLPSTTPNLAQDNSHNVWGETEVEVEVEVGGEGAKGKKGKEREDEMMEKVDQIFESLKGDDEDGSVLPKDRKTDHSDYKSV